MLKLLPGAGYHGYPLPADARRRAQKLQINQMGKIGVRGWANILATAGV
jgi:hypothetical protein